MAGGPTIPNQIWNPIYITSNSSIGFGQWVLPNKWYLGLCPVLPTRPRLGVWVWRLGDRGHGRWSNHSKSTSKNNIRHLQLLNWVRSVSPSQQVILGFMSSFYQHDQHWEDDYNVYEIEFISSGPHIWNPIRKLIYLTSNTSTWFGQWFLTNEW